MSAVSEANGSAGAVGGATAPPHNLDAEQSVLGAVLLSDRSLYALVIEEGLRGEDFYRERHGAIYEAMLALYNESEPVDVLTVTDRLRQMGKLEEAGGAASVDELTGLVPAAGTTPVSSSTLAGPPICSSLPAWRSRSITVSTSTGSLSLYSASIVS